MRGPAENTSRFKYDGEIIERSIAGDFSRITVGFGISRQRPQGFFTSGFEIMGLGSPHITPGYRRHLQISLPTRATELRDSRLTAISDYQEVTADSARIGDRRPVSPKFSDKSEIPLPPVTLYKIRRTFCGKWERRNLGITEAVAPMRPQIDLACPNKKPN